MRRAGWLAALVLLATCSPLVRAEVRFVIAGAPVETMRFRAAVVVACDPFNLALPRAQPPARPAPDPGGRMASRVEDGALVVAIAERASHCYLHVTGWYDSDGDGRVGPGDLVGSLPEALDVRDRGFCNGNLTTTAPVELRPLRGHD